MCQFALRPSHPMVQLLPGLMFRSRFLHIIVYPILAWFSFRSSSHPSCFSVSDKFVPHLVSAQFLDEVRLWLSCWTRLNTGTDDAILPWLSSWTRF